MQCLVGTSFLVHRQLSSPRLLTSGKGRELSRVSLIMALIPLMMVSSSLSNQPLKPSPPNTIILGIKLQHRGFGGTNIQSIASCVRLVHLGLEFAVSPLSQSRLSCLSKAPILPESPGCNDCPPGVPIRPCDPVCHSTCHAAPTFGC